ncbi:MAG: phage tail tape measure protein [Symploca sp. SIO2C1]|nr:phage tail tape measure protein [Symploca sp. SIO2C1]
MAITETIKFNADVNGALSGFNQIENKAQALSGKLNSIGGTAIGVGAAIATPIAAGFGAVLKVAGDFEAQMNQVKAVSGATSAEFEKLRNQAKDLGSTTEFSAKQAAQAQGFLAMAGLETNEIFTALPSTLNLATAGQLDLGRAADIASNIMTGYGFKAKDLGRVNDVLAKTATSANTNVSQLGYAFSYAAPIAKAAGLSFEETSAIIGKLSDAGIQGSSAGTTLRGAISSILKPSNDAKKTLARLGVEVSSGNGKIRSMIDIVGDLKRAGATTTDIITIFGEEAGTGLASLVDQGSASIQELKNKLDSAGGSAEKMADIMRGGLQGEMKNLGSAMEGLALAIADTGILDLAAKGVAAVTSVVRSISQLPQPVLYAGTAITALVGAAGGFLVVGGTLAIVVGNAITAFAALAPMAAGAGAAIGAIAAPVALGAAALVSIGVVVYQVINNWEALKDTTAAVFGAVKATITSWVTEVKFRFVQVKTFVTSTWNSIVESVRANVGEVVSQAQSMANRVIAAVKALPGQALAAGRSLASNFAQGIIAAASAPIKAVQDMVSRIRGLLPSSPAKWGALSDIDIVGHGMMSTIASSITQAAPIAVDAMSEAASGMMKGLSRERLLEKELLKMGLVPDKGGYVVPLKYAGLESIRPHDYFGDTRNLVGDWSIYNGVDMKKAQSLFKKYGFGFSPDDYSYSRDLFKNGTREYAKIDRNRNSNTDATVNSSTSSSSGNTIIEYKPQINITSSAEPQSIINALESRDEQFLDLIERVTGRRTRTEFA